MITEKEKLRRVKISKTLTGFKRPPFSEEHKQKLREANLGKKLPKHVKDILLSHSIGNKHNLGRKLTEEHREKLKGRIPWNKGIEHSAIKGENNHNWKGGITPKNILLRHSVEYKQWRKSVFERDDYTCVFCKKRGGELNADHIKQWAFFPELRFDMNNGRTLCVECHRTTFKQQRICQK